MLSINARLDLAHFHVGLISFLLPFVTFNLLAIAFLFDYFFFGFQVHVVVNAENYERDKKGEKDVEVLPFQPPVHLVELHLVLFLMGSVLGQRRGWESANKPRNVN